MLSYLWNQTREKGCNHMSVSILSDFKALLFKVLTYFDLSKEGNYLPLVNTSLAIGPLNMIQRFLLLWSLSDIEVHKYDDINLTNVSSFTLCCSACPLRLWVTSWRFQIKWAPYLLHWFFTLTEWPKTLWLKGVFF